MADVMSMEDIRAAGACSNIDFSGVDWNSVRLPPGEDFSIKSDDDDLNEEDSLEFDAGFVSIIVVDNLRSSKALCVKFTAKLG
ncbi:hypothetical protein L1987_83627 [Smallanthus sonchifolius]|uniref:Uncharacterized protein n=1 Tax=Smallanthus sonchifolius TaxID=185202 RepID=A0ACB8YCD7_9ASTR|nr:hypothetical protein L1987_83627 [Smallanthus sonchifolius]